MSHSIICLKYKADDNIILNFIIVERTIGKGKAIELLDEFLIIYT